MWEMQSHMFQYVYPAVEDALLEGLISDEEINQLVGEPPDGHDWPAITLTHVISKAAIETACTTIGGHEFYLSRDMPHTTIPFATEERMLAYWG